MDLLSGLFIFFPKKEIKQFSHKYIHPKHFRVSGKGNFSNITADSVAPTEIANQSSQSLQELVHYHQCRILNLYKVVYCLKPFHFTSY